MTTTSPLQLNTAGGITPRSSNPVNGSNGNGGSQFSAMLSGELERSSTAFALASMTAPAPAPAPAPAQNAAKPADADKPAEHDAAPQPAAKPAESKAESSDAKDTTADKADEKKDDESTAKTGDPASAMLALMASLHKPVAAARQHTAVLEAAQAAAAGEELTAHVGTDAWNDQVGQKVVYMLGAEDQTASLTLNPPDLGPLQVVLSVSNGQADVTFSSNQLEVRQALENALPRLQEMMGESGIALGNATVNAGMSNGGQAQQDQAMASSGFGRGGNNGRGHGGNEAGTVVGEATVRPATRTAAIGDRGMVDTFA
jgi:flagellar hook-length control protein FliK